MNIAITGSTGFVGHNLVSFLRRKGKRIIGVSRTPCKSHEIKYAEMDSIFWSSIQVFIHLAGKAHDLKKTSNDKEYFDVNTDLTKSLFNKFLQSDCEVFIFMSSVKAAASQVDDWLKEEDKFELDNPYGKSKRLAEEYLLSQDLPENKKVIILRPCMIHGAGNKGNLNLLYKFAKLGIPYPLASFENSRSFMSINNLTYIVDKIIESKDIESGVYNVADDKILSTNRLIELMAKQSDTNIKLLHIKPSVIKCFAKLGDALHLPLNSHRLQKLTESYKVSNRKIKKALQIEYLPLTAEEGIYKTLKSFN
jgi:nucleoside-diphosphate-sugar epimerase